MSCIVANLIATCLPSWLCKHCISLKGPMGNQSNVFDVTRISQSQIKLSSSCYSGVEIARQRLKKEEQKSTIEKWNKGYFLMIMYKILLRHFSSNFQKHNNSYDIRIFVIWDRSLILFIMDIFSVAVSLRYHVLEKSFANLIHVQIISGSGEDPYVLRF